MLKLGEHDLAKYPFLKEAGIYLKEQGFTLEQLSNDDDFENIRSIAFERIKRAIEGKTFNISASNHLVLPIEIFSFLLAVVLLELAGKSTIINKFALIEAQRVEKFLEQDLGDMNTDIENKMATKIIKELFSIDIKKQDKYFIIPFYDYIKHSVGFHEREWKIVNRRVNNGFVFLNAHQIVRLIRQKLINHIKDNIKQSKRPPMFDGLKDMVSNINDISKKFEVNVVYTGEYPPCIKHAIKTLEDGENLSHSGRFMLATFLFARGKSIQDIAPLFKNAPDYNERVTLYQLNNLSGDTGTKYTCPSCIKLDTQKLCHKISACDNIYNPVQFGSKHM